MAEVMNLIPESHYINACNSIRKKNPNVSNKIKSGFLADAIDGIKTILDENASSFTELNCNSTNYPAGFLSECYLLEKVTFPFAHSISNVGLKGNENLVEVHFPLATTIEFEEFRFCTKLSTVDTPNVESIGNNAFTYCRSITEARYDKVTTIGYGAFNSCTNLKSAVFPKLVTMGGIAFAGDTALEKIVLANDVICELTNDPVFPPQGFVYVPKVLLDGYKKAPWWVVYADQIRAIEDYPDIVNLPTP